jgi:hypothetical protein
MLDLTPGPSAVFFLGETGDAIPALLLLRTLHLMAVSRVSPTNPAYRATILAKLHMDGFDIPSRTIDTVKREFSKLDVSEHLALKALNPKYMSERYSEIPWTGSRLYLESITPRLTVAGKLVMTAEVKRQHRVTPGLQTIRESYGSAEYVHEASELGDDDETFSTPLLRPMNMHTESSDDDPQDPRPSSSFFLEAQVLESPQSLVSIDGRPEVDHRVAKEGFERQDDDQSLLENTSGSSEKAVPNGGDDFGEFARYVEVPDVPASQSNGLRTQKATRAGTPAKIQLARLVDKVKIRKLLALYREGKSRGQIDKILGFVPSEEEMDSLLGQALDKERAGQAESTARSRTT